MPIYLEHGVTAHPKFLIAGEILGGTRQNGFARAFYLWAEALSWAREHLTDGKVPVKFVQSFVRDPDPIRVAKVLANRRVRLWHRTREGWQIHDYDEYNRTAKQVKALRANGRARAARYRERHSGGKADA